MIYTVRTNRKIYLKINHFLANPIVIESGHFSWGEQDTEPVLKNINLHVPRGSLVAVVGAVGSGKSSLLSALLGEMNKMSGRVNTTGKYIKHLIKFIIYTSDDCLYFCVHFRKHSVCAATGLDSERNTPRQHFIRSPTRQTEI